jgi:hypothetical protein
MIAIRDRGRGLGGSRCPPHAIAKYLTLPHRRAEKLGRLNRSATGATSPQADESALFPASPRSSMHGGRRRL